MIATKQKIVNALSVPLKKKLPKDISIIEISSKESRKLNREYRNKDYPTNVLSFRYGAEYGEILACLPVIKREAKEQGNSFDYQVTWMIVHGMIHLAGLHHESSAATARRTERIEQRVLNHFFPRKSNKPQAT